jgi:hypothetical protein
VQKFFEGLSQKNNLCVLTGDKTAMGSVENAARQLYAAQKADSRIPKGHLQRDELGRKQQTYEQDLNATILNLFDKVLFPIQRAGRPSQLASKALDMTRDTNRPFDGEAQIEKTLTSNPLKLYLDIEKDFDPIRDKAQDLLWPENQDEARWSDVVDRYTEQAGMPWLPPRGLDMLKSIACNRSLWEDLGNGYVTKKPQKKKTSVQVIAESEPDDDGKVRLRINAQNAGPAPRIYYASDDPVSESSPQLIDQNLTTNALRMNFLVLDQSGQYETGDIFTCYELVPWAGSSRYRAASAELRLAIRAGQTNADQEAIMKNEVRFGGTREAGTTEPAGQPTTARGLQGDLGLVVVSCTRGDVRQSPNGLWVYDDDGQREVPVEGLHDERMAELDEMYQALTTRRPVRHDGRWGTATLEVVLAVLQSAREHREILLSHQCDAY